MINKSEFFVLPYYGNKSSNEYAKGVTPLLPQKIVGAVSCFMGGSGEISSIIHGLGHVRKIGMDSDKSVIAFHRAAKYRPNELMSSLSQLVYSKDYYEKCLNLVDEYRSGKVYDDVTVATAVYGVACMSRNNMRIKSYRSLEPNPKYIKGSAIYEKKRKELQALGNKMKDMIPYVVSDLNYVLKDVELINGSVFDYSHLWEKQDYLIICDVPYLYEKRGIKDTRKSAGYLDDWQDTDHARFIETIVKKQRVGLLRANMWICSNFELNEDGEIPLEDIRNDPYAKALLPLGWRVVVVQKKYSTNIISERTFEKKKKPKVEVLFINYRDIVGSWNDYTYYDYEDVFG